MSRILTVDGGVVTGGWCAWDTEQFISQQGGKGVKSLTVPLAAGSVKCPAGKVKATNKKLAYVNQAQSTLDLMLKNCGWDQEHYVQVHCEEPKILGGGRGFAAKGDALHIMFFLGLLAHACHMKKIAFHPVDLSWKGNMSKDQTNRRVVMLYNRAKRLKALEKVMPETNAFGSHAWDACCMGLFVMGVKIG